ncbi:MAG: Holliday junction resolvase RuvX, partial [Cyanobacteriota bacterium]|nr:Holliday junction resolvase RuvX [Cyanobacteriota bacterium]
VVLRGHCRERSVQGLVVGLPLDAAGQPTAQAEHCQRYGLRLAAALLLEQWLAEGPELKPAQRSASRSGAGAADGGS